MTTIIPQSELTRKAIDWICEQGGEGASAAELCRHIEAAAVRFNLGPLDVEFLVRFFANGSKDEQDS